MDMYLGAFLVIAIGLVGASAIIASTKNRDVIGWVFWSVFFFPLPLFIIVALSPKLPVSSKERRSRTLGKATGP